MRTCGRGEVVTDEYQRTTNPRIWAAGDVTGCPPYVYTGNFGGVLPVMLAVAGQVEDGTLALLTALPLRRRAILARKTAAMALQALLLAAR